MSEICPRGIKCPCFCCPETDCEKYKTEPPEWIKVLLEDDSFGDTLIKIAEGMNNEEKTAN